jgi:hypothetical protein
MPYNYAENRPFVFTEEGQETLLRIRDLARKHIELSGATCYASDHRGLDRQLLGHPGVRGSARRAW